MKHVKKALNVTKSARVRSVILTSDSPAMVPIGTVAPVAMAMLTKNASIVDSLASVYWIEQNPGKTQFVKFYSWKGEF